MLYTVHIVKCTFYPHFRLFNIYNVKQRDFNYDESIMIILVLFGAIFTSSQNQTHFRNYLTNQSRLITNQSTSMERIKPYLTNQSRLITDQSTILT